ncbi:Rap1a/Tai family immunity protein [Paracoccus sp. J39]|uniref:Rap1a/Tai family immunity protein n=1 Tax=Paracoccus sp. J39 TaxID=935848 RepID=UPI000491F79E|nr:Rap1a/Tai family immunity protein [Paracoccus sp. J39]
MRLVAAVLGLVVAGPVLGQDRFYTGNELHDLCRSNRNFVVGYLAGFTDGLWMVDADQNTNELNACIPNGVTLGQLADVVCAHLVKFPAARHMPASRLTRGAFNIAFPCR